MKRNVDFNEISDGKRYKSGDLAKISCNGCKGCSECCRVTDDTIHLDPYDICMLSVAIGKTFSEMQSIGLIALTVEEGLIVPYLAKTKDGACVFLSQEGLCRVHEFRPGFCRLFPLGRIYNEDDTFDYFIQIHECPYPTKTKVKIKQWLAIPSLSKYEQYISDYHKYISSLKNSLKSADETASRNINIMFLNQIIIAPYDSDYFYDEFYKRINNN